MKKTIYRQKVKMYENCDTTEGETIEAKVRRVVQNNEPISDGAPIIYTERKDGVIPAYDIRTDRWIIALDAMDKVNTAKREAFYNPEKVKGGENEEKETTKQPTN